MQGNGFKIFMLGLFLAVSGWYLFPTLQDYMNNRKQESMSVEAWEEYREDNFSSLEKAREGALKRGLDLEGGMLVILEVQVDRLMRALAIESERSDDFEEALAAATERTGTEQTEYIDAMMEEFEKRDPNFLLSRYFRDEADEITRRSSNSDVQAYLKKEAGEAIDRAVEIIRDRVDRFGVSEPSIQKQGDRRVIVELPGVDDAQRVRNLLRGTAKLEFRLMPDPEAVNRSMNRIFTHYQPQSDTAAAVADSLMAENADADSTTTIDDMLAPVETQDTNPLLDVLSPAQGGQLIGYATATDTAEVRQLIYADQVVGMLPKDFVLMWSSAPEQTTTEGVGLYAALAVRNVVELSGDVITDARADIDQNGQAKVSMDMNAEGGTTWARVTGANVGKPVAITMDNVVYSWPEVKGKIGGGRSEINGMASQEEASDLVTILKSGALPAPVNIVAEQLVGPSLGARSIKAGTLSLIFGMILVVIFMVIYYRTGGIIADIALLLNVLFIFGILAGFKATLTLPGIAGIVLTIGMAVDANVLIFERIREELNTGKSLKAAVSGGYANALNAIMDANITTFLVGAILYSFGQGPIKGFAVTLMAGIASSLFTAIIVTRLITDWAVIKRKFKISYG